MDNRKKSILGAVVKEYIDTAKPVGSKVLVQKYGFKLSPATLRKEMLALSKMGYLKQPHISSGRVPTTIGYRFFVDSIMNYVDLAKREQAKLEAELRKMHENYEQLLRETSRLLSEATGNVVLTNFGDHDSYRHGIANILEQPEFSGTDKAREVARLFDNLDEDIDEIDVSSEKTVQVYIGPETKITRDADCSLVISKFTLPSGKDGCIVILGPTRMDYDHNISLIRYVSKFLSSGVFCLFVFNFLNDTFLNY